MNAANLKNLNSILGYGCVAPGAKSAKEFYSALVDGRELRPPSPSQAETKSALAAMTDDLVSSWKQVFDLLDADARSRIERSGLGVIFASTKGCIDDFVFDSDSPLRERDPLVPVLTSFLNATGLRATEKICVSNACVSSLAAVYLASAWIRSVRCEDVLVIASDRASRFVSEGFKTLKVLTEDDARPFSKDRSGFFIGTASAAVLISKHASSGRPKIAAVAIESDASVMTNSELSFSTLLRTCQRLNAAPPDLIIAHGTGTTINDMVEDRVFSRLAVEWKTKPLVTNVKWSIGHSLGTSGAMDLIAACEVLKSSRVFSIATTRAIDPIFEGNYLTKGKTTDRDIRRVLISSLGFGGTYGALQIESGT